jgi:hypothetical protein
MLAHPRFRGEDMFDHGLWDNDDDQLLQVLKRHEAGLSRRQSNVA